MPFLAVGVEHKTAPLSIRERIADEDDVLSLLAHPAIVEAVSLFTCNRAELYMYVEDERAAVERVSDLLTSGDDEVRGYLQVWRDMDAVEHLFRVAAGLESQILGEPQILSQAADAMQHAQSRGTVGLNLHTLFRSAISCARQARAGTALGRLNPSVATAAVRAATRAIGGEGAGVETLRESAALVIGAGKIARLVAQELRGKTRMLFIANRTASVAVESAAACGARAAPFAEIPRLLNDVDLVISATGAHHYVVPAEDFPALGHREHPLQVFDLAIPRDIDPAAAELPGIELHDLDDLLPDDLRERWESDVRSMEGVIAAEIREFMAWYLTRRAVPVIANLRSHVEAVQAQELKRVAPQLRDLTPKERAAVESLTGRLVDKMFHHLVLRLRLAAQTDPKLVEAAEFFFLHGEGSLFEHAVDSSPSTPPTDPAARNTQFSAHD